MLSVYGAEEEEKVADEIWLERAGREGWIVMTKDGSIRRRTAELAMVRQYKVKLFYLVSGSLTGEQTRDRIMTNINRICQRARKPGPWICAVHERRVTQI